jgi:hypothetical protein
MLKMADKKKHAVERQLLPPIKRRPLKQQLLK